MKIRAEVKFGNNKKNLDSWQRSANPWTITLKNGRKQMTIPFFTGSACGEPTAFDALYCLVADSSSVADGFEWFCSAYDYDENSRAHERIYNECLDNRRKLERLLGERFAEVMAMDEEDLKAICK